MYKLYLQIVKPNIVLSNLISTIGGFLLASKGNINYTVFICTLVGILFIMSSGCIFNNYIDRDIDQKMERTKNRVLVQGLISSFVVVMYASFLGLLGFIVLWIGTNYLVLLLGIMGFIIYVGIYSLYMKRYSIHSPIIGSFAGAIPVIVGYCAVTNKFDIEAFILLIIFSLWQIPHFYAISIFRFTDYQIANIPSLPRKRGILVTKHHIVCYIIAFFISALMLALQGYTGVKYLSVTSCISLWWLIIAIRGYNVHNVLDERIWAKKLFLFSIIVIISLSVMMSIDFTLPNVITSS